MSGDDTIQVQGVVIEVLRGNRFRVVLPNGHRLMGFVPVRFGELADGLQVGTTVNLEMSAFDFSKGRICLNASQESL